MAITDAPLRRAPQTRNTSPAAGGGLGPNTPERIGKYRIDGTIGVGAMGVVYRAFDTSIQREVAIKTIRPELLDEADGEAWRGRFAREVQAAARCLHPNVVTIYDFGETEGAGGAPPAPYIVMEYCHGRPLHDYLKHLGRFEPHLALYVIGQVLAALGAAHAGGIVHRDIKPGNILLLDDGTVKVTDFGIARVESSTMTAHGSMIGTPSYMSPEQFAGGAIDARSDLFSAAVLLFEMLAGCRPFAGKTSAEIMYRVMQEEPPDLAALAPGIGPALAAAVTRALAKDPAARYRDSRAFSDALAGAWAAAGGGSGASPDEATVIAPQTGRPVGAGSDPPSLNRLLRDMLPTDGGRIFGTLSGMTGQSGSGIRQGMASSAARPPGRGRWLIAGAAAALVLLGLGGWAMAPQGLRDLAQAITGSGLPKVAPYQISVVSGAQVVTLEGHAPSAQTAAAMRSAIRLELAIEGKRLEGDLMPAEGAPNENWPHFAPRMVSVISALSSPSLLVIDDRAVVAGLALTEPALEEVRAAAAALAAAEGYALDFRAVLKPQSLNPFREFLDAPMVPSRQAVRGG